MRRVLRILSKVLYALPLLVSTGIGLLILVGIYMMSLLFSTDWATGQVGEIVMPLAWIGLGLLLLLPGSLPLTGSILLMCRKWWGCCFGIVYGAGLALLSPSTLLGRVLDRNTSLFLGLGIVIYYGAMGMLCVWLEMGRNDSPETPAGVE